MARISISSWSFFTSLGGYGIVNTAAAKYLSREGVDVSCYPKYSPKPGSREWEILDEEERELFTRPFRVEKIGISGTTPFEFGENQSEVKIAMTMAESDRLGKSWVDAANGMTAIIVPNEFERTVFRESGVVVPVTVLADGIDTEKFFFLPRPKRDVFTFGLCGYLNERKGVFELIRAFASEFSKEEPVKLLLHSSNPFFRYYKRFNDSRISTTSHYRSLQELRDFYQTLDCFVFPSKAEGIGYPPREAMATGLPVILTNWSGLAEIADPSYSYPLSMRRLIPRTDMLEQPGNWAEIDIQELMYWMRWVYEHREEAKRKGERAAQEIKMRYNWSRQARIFKEFLLHYV